MAALDCSGPCVLHVFLLPRKVKAPERPEVRTCTVASAGEAWSRPSRGGSRGLGQLDPKAFRECPDLLPCVTSGETEAPRSHWVPSFYPAPVCEPVRRLRGHPARGRGDWALDEPETCHSHPGNKIVKLLSRV